MAMLRKLSGVHVRSSVTGRVLTLDRNEYRILNDSWRTVTDKQQLGRNILLQIFNENQSLKRLFSFQCDIEDDDAIIRDKNFIKHAEVFAMFIHVAVNQLLDGHADEMIQFVHRVGTAHSSFQKVSFDAENWLLFKSAVLDQLQPHYTKNNEKYSKQFGRGVWDRFMMFLIMEMKTAFHQQLLKRLTNKDAWHLLHSTLVENYERCTPQNNWKILNEPTDNCSLKSLNRTVEPLTEPLPRRKLRMWSATSNNHSNDSGIGLGVSDGNLAITTKSKPGNLPYSESSAEGFVSRKLKAIDSFLRRLRISF